MTIKTKKLDIRLTLSNGGRLRIWEDHPYFDADYQIKLLDETIPQHEKYLKRRETEQDIKKRKDSLKSGNSFYKGDFSIDELKVQLMELKAARRLLIELKNAKSL